MGKMYDKALEIATAAHKNQKDKSGVDYIKHPVTVASFVSGEEAKVVALLHDVLEDTDVTEAELRAIFGDTITDAVVTMTHKDGEPYMSYIERVALNPLSKEVKLADLKHNMDLGRLPAVTDKDIERIEKKYKPALAYLLAH